MTPGEIFNKGKAAGDKYCVSIVGSLGCTHTRATPMLGLLGEPCQQRDVHIGSSGAEAYKFMLSGPISLIARRVTNAGTRSDKGWLHVRVE